MMKAFMQSACRFVTSRSNVQNVSKPISELLATWEPFPSQGISINFHRTQIFVGCPPGVEICGVAEGGEPLKNLWWRESADFHLGLFHSKQVRAFMFFLTL